MSMAVRYVALGRLVVAGSNEGTTQAQEQLAPKGLVRTDEPECLEGAPILEDGLFVCAGVHRLIAGPASVVPGLLAFPGGRHLGEVVGELSQMRSRITAVQLFDRLAYPSVQLDPGADGELVVDHLPHQGVREAEDADRGGFLAHDTQRHGLRHGSEGAIGRKVAGGAHQPEIEVPTHDGGGRERAEGVGRQRRDPPTDHGPNALGDGDARSLLPVKGALRGFEASDLPNEQRVALGGLVDRAHLGRRRYGPRDLLHEPTDLLAVQTSEPDDRSFTGESCEHVLGFGRRHRFRFAIRGHDEHPRRASVSHQEPEQEKRRAIGVVEVVQDEHEGLGRGRVRQIGRDGFEQVEALCVGLDGVDRVRGLAKARGEVRHQPGDLGGPGRDQRPEGPIVELAGEGPDDLGPRPVGRGTRALPTSAPQGQGSTRHPLSCQPVRERGLTDPGLAGDQEDAATAVDGVQQPGHELGQLPIPADEGPLHGFPPRSTRRPFDAVCHLPRSQHSRQGEAGPIRGASGAQDG